MGMERIQGKGNQERFVIENVTANGNQSSSPLGNSFFFFFLNFT